MKDIQIFIDGVEKSLMDIDLNELNEHIDSLKRGIENAPVFSKTKHRLIMKLTPAVLNMFKIAIKSNKDFISFDSEGDFGTLFYGCVGWNEIKNFYSSEGTFDDEARPIFE